MNMHLPRLKLQLKGTVFLVLTALMMNSCHMQKLTVGVYEAPAIEFPPEVRGILVSSRFVPATGDYEAVQWGFFESVDSTLWGLSEYYADSFSAFLDSTERYISRSDFDQRMLRNNNDSLPERLPWDGLKKITDKYRASGIAVLQGFGIDEKEVEIIPDDKGYVAKKEITVKSAWRIYQPERRRILDESIYNFTKEFNSFGKTEEEAASGLPPHDEMLRQACFWAAGEYARLIIPGITEVERDYYKDGHEKLVEAHEAIQKGNWTLAETKWNYLSYKSDDDEVKAKASYNMALYCEMDGRLNQALGFARKSNNLLPHRRHLSLINELTIKMFEEEEKLANGEIIRNW